MTKPTTEKKKCIIELGLHETTLSNHSFSENKCLYCPLKITEAYMNMLKEKGIVK